MNRHFYNFIAAFNAAAKTKKWTLFFPIRNRFTYDFLVFLMKERLIEGFRFVDQKNADLFTKNDPRTGHATPLGKKGSPYETVVRIDLRHELVSKIYSVSTPGKHRSYNVRRLHIYSSSHAMYGARGVVICSSPLFGGLCTADQLTKLGHGGLVICVVLLK